MALWPCCTCADSARKRLAPGRRIPACPATSRQLCDCRVAWFRHCAPDLAYAAPLPTSSPSVARQQGLVNGSLAIDGVSETPAAGQSDVRPTRPPQQVPAADTPARRFIRRQLVAARSAFVGFDLATLSLSVLAPNHDPSPDRW